MDIHVLKYLSSLLLFVQGYFCYSSSASTSAAASASSQSYYPNFPLQSPTHDGWIPHLSSLPPPLPPLIIDNTNKDNNIMNLLFLLMALKNKKPINPCCCCPHHHPPPPHHLFKKLADSDDCDDPYESPVAEITVNGGYFDEPVSCGNAKITTSPGSEPNEIHLVIRTDFAPPC